MRGRQVQWSQEVGGIVEIAAWRRIKDALWEPQSSGSLHPIQGALRSGFILLCPPGPHTVPGAEQASGTGYEAQLPQACQVPRLKDLGFLNCKMAIRQSQMWPGDCESTLSISQRRASLRRADESSSACQQLGVSGKAAACSLSALRMGLGMPCACPVFVVVHWLPVVDTALQAGALSGWGGALGTGS